MQEEVFLFEATAWIHWSMKMNESDIGRTYLVITDSGSRRRAESGESKATVQKTCVWPRWNKAEP